MRRLGGCAVAMVFYLAAVGSSGAGGATLLVPSEGYPTIQSAINAAQNGDTVQVAAGTYLENLVWSKKDIALVGAGPEQTIVDGNGAGSCLTISGGVPATARVEGFTFTNGNAPIGGGLYVMNSSPAIGNSVIRGNRSAQYGGGMALTSSASAVTGCTVAGNESYQGGGVFSWGSGVSCTFANCVITGNKATAIGGIGLSGGPQVLRDSSITANEASYAAGVCVMSSTSVAQVSGNVISENRATLSGGGIFFISCSVAVVNNVIARNTAQAGGGIYGDSSSGTVSSNQISANAVSGTGGGVFVAKCGALAVSENLVEGNEAAATGGGMVVGASPGTVTGNIVMGNRSGAGPGGLGIHWSGNVTASGNTIIGNSAYGLSSSGGGVALFGMSSGTLSDNIVTGNTAGVGGGVYAYSYCGPWTLTNNTIAGNSAAFNTGGVYIYHSTTFTLTANAITGNTRDGLFCFGTSPRIEGNEIANNTGCGIRLTVCGVGEAELVSTPTIVANTIGGNGQWGILCQDTAPANAASLEADNTLTANGSGQVWQWWYGNVRALQQDGTPAAGARVSIFNNDGDTTPDGGSPFTTRADGYTDDPNRIYDWARITEFEVTNQGVRRTMTPQTILATLGALTGTTTHNWSGRRQTAIVVLGANRPPVADAGDDQEVEQTSPAGAEVTLDGSGSSDPDDDALTYAWTWPGGSATGVNPTITLPLGTTTITLVVNDGQADSEPDTVAITVQDTTPPTLVIPADITVEQASAAGTVVDYSVAATDVCDASPTVVCTPPSGSVFPLGVTTVTCTATDGSGNQTAKSFTVTVRDTTPPELVAPSPIVVEQATADGTKVEWQCLAADVCDAEVDVVCEPPPGNVFPLGTTTVTCTATDDSGNQTVKTFTVTVKDTTPPEIESAWATPNALWSPNHKMVDIALGAVVGDVCDAAPGWKIVGVTCNEPVNGQGDGNTSPDWEITGDQSLRLRAERSGTGSGRVYTITIEATDTSGNASTATCTVTVPHDQKKPGGK
ncbi:MAG TPA: right-handed parallel beta-helix repeat-containing protein [Planctomycetota bacterium]|nr:right-handed parallel beta-helix repeat-containing protein [Planctomycetota bacterium]